MNVNVPSVFFRFSGWALLIAGIMHTLIQFVHLDDVPEGMAQMSYFVDVAVWSHVALIFAVALTLFGLTGLFLRHIAVLRWWGWVGFACMFLVFYYDVTHAVLQVFQYPILFDGIQDEQKLKEVSDLVMRIQTESGIGSTLMRMLFPVMLLGTPLMAVSLWRARIYSKWPAVAQIVLLVVLFVPIEALMRYAFPVSFLVYSWYGALLAFERLNVPQASSAGHAA
ncbi:hypothetical protein ACFFK0_16205 [Paenibacillus chartarius]|uniref:DUF4386 family protein n=1 Tax=Paenibacillus chartarius TaxID=747481 RepID=A0ABV6DMV3_9BACL